MGIEAKKAEFSSIELWIMKHQCQPDSESGIADIEKTNLNAHLFPHPSEIEEEEDERG